MARLTFRQAALDQAQGIHQLDRLAVVTRPSAWAALAAVMVILAAVLGWAIFGRLPTSVQGQGLLIAQDGLVHEAVAEGAGVVEAVLVERGSRVTAGMPVARLVLPELAQRIAATQEAVAERAANLQRVRDFSVATLQRENLAIAERRRILNGQLEAARQREAQSLRQLQEQDRLAAQSLVTRAAALQARMQANRTSQEVGEALEQLSQLDLRALDLAGRAEQREAEAELPLAEARRELASLQARLARQREIVAPATGRVIEVRAARGATVRAGEAVVAVEDASDRLELLLFVPPADGRRVKQGMRVRVNPSTARWEEYGAILGHIGSISDFPATREGMAALLRNNELVSAFTRNGPPYVARVTLEADSATVSGYRWSADKGGTMPLASGTLATAFVWVSEQAPITLVLPLLRELSGVDF